MRWWPSRLAVALFWLLHWLPLPWLRGLGWLIGQLLHAFGHERRTVALTNLRLCFPELSEAERAGIARRHFVAFARAFLDRSLGWWASPARCGVRRSSGSTMVRMTPSTAAAGSRSVRPGCW